MTIKTEVGPEVWIFVSQLVVEHQMLVFSFQNAYKTQPGHISLLERSFSSSSPVFLPTPQLFVLVRPNVGPANQKPSAVTLLHYKVTERCFGVKKNMLPQILALVTQQISLDPDSWF